jgi:hypothetical protein
MRLMPLLEVPRIVRAGCHHQSISIMDVKGDAIPNLGWVVPAVKNAKLSVKKHGRDARTV